MTSANVYEPGDEDAKVANTVNTDNELTMTLAKIIAKRMLRMENKGCL